MMKLPQTKLINPVGTPQAHKKGFTLRRGSRVKLTCCQTKGFDIKRILKTALSRLPWLVNTLLRRLLHRVLFIKSFIKGINCTLCLGNANGRLKLKQNGLKYRCNKSNGNFVFSGSDSITRTSSFSKQCGYVAQQLLFMNQLTCAIVCYFSQIVNSLRKLR